MLEVVGDKSQKLKWPGYGFSLDVPDGALPPGVTASVAIKVILAGRFQFPENSQLISAIYWISASEQFLEEVAVNIQHCAVIKSDEEASKFRFIIAKCSQKELPYRFRVREGVFKPHTQSATIMLKQFSLVGEVGPEGTEQNYAILQFYKHYPSPAIVDFLFAVVQDREPDLQVQIYM